MDTKKLPTGYWYVIAVVKQEPGRWRAWCGPKGYSRMERFDAPTEAEARRMAKEECQRRNALQEQCG